MAYEDLREFLNPHLDLPIGGKTYRFASPNAEEGLRLRRLFANPENSLTDTEELDEIVALLGAEWDEEQGKHVGGLWQELVDDGVTWPEIMHAGRTALLHYAVGPTVGELNWKELAGEMGNPLPPEPKPVTGARSSNPRKRAAAKKSTKK